MESATPTKLGGAGSNIRKVFGTLYMSAHSTRSISQILHGAP